MSVTGQRGVLLVLALGALLAKATMADDLGRLFTSVAERARIDAARSGSPSQGQVADTAPGGRVILNGTLRGSDGKALVWINGRRVHPDRARGLTLMGDGRVRLTGREGPATLKPGQGIDPATGKVFDHYTAAPAPVAESAAAKAIPSPAGAASAAAATSLAKSAATAAPTAKAN